MWCAVSECDTNQQLWGDEEGLHCPQFCHWEKLRGETRGSVGRCGDVVWLFMRLVGLSVSGGL